MRTLALSVLALLPAIPAFGDASIPHAPEGNGRNRGDWTQRCAERLERARDDVAKKFPEFANVAAVEVTSREIAEPGDPTAKATEDYVKFRANLENGDPAHDDVKIASSYWVQIEPFHGETMDGKSVPGVWARVAGYPLLKKYNYEPTTRRSGTLWADRTRPALARLFENVFTPAVEDCLKMKRAK